MQLFFKVRFQPIAFQKLKDWKLEKSCMKDDICLLDHHQRSHWNTITIGLKGMIDRVLQLNISQLESSFNSLLEKHFVLDLPHQPNPKPNPIWDRTGKPVETEHVFVEKGKTSQSQEIVGKRTDLDNFDTVETNLRHSAKGSSDAYDVPISLTDNEKITGSPDALCPLTLQLWLQTSHFSHLSKPPLVHHKVHSSFEEMYLFQADDGKHLWDWEHRSSSCWRLPATITCPVDRLCCCVSQRQSLLDLLCSRDQKFLSVSAVSFEEFITTAPHVEFEGATRGHSLWPEV